MNTVATIERPSRVDAFVGEVLAPDRRQRIIEALPNHLPVEKFEAAFRDAVMTNPDILKCDPREVFRAVHNVASTGLSFNPMFGEAWLVVGFSKKDSRHKPQVRIGTRGYMKLARQSGEISLIFAREVYAEDVFETDLYKNEVQHTADVFGDRGPLIGVYAKVEFRDGSEDFEPMSLRELERVRDQYSDGWKAFKANKIRSTPWADSFEEMAKKTVLRRLLKRLPQSVELARALQADLDEPEETIEKLAPSRGRPRLAAALQMAATPRPSEPPVPQPIPPQPEPEEDEPGEEPGEEEGEDGAHHFNTQEDNPMGTVEEKKLDQEPMPASDMVDEERTKLYEAGREAALKGPQKLRFWKARQHPDQLARLTQQDLEKLGEISRQTEVVA